jgi:uncharacterized protein (TIGR03905 family)
MKGNNPLQRFIYHTRGVCPPEIHFKLSHDILKDIRFVGGGCPGNAQLVARLIEGKSISEALDYLTGIDCRDGTSCPDQLASAILAAKNGRLDSADSFRVLVDTSAKHRVGLIGDLGGNPVGLQALVENIRDNGVGDIYCLGNLTGDSPENSRVIKLIRQLKIVTIQGENDWRYAHGKEDSDMTDLEQKDRDWLVRLPQVLSFEIEDKKGIAFFGSYIQTFPDYSDFEPYALEMNMVCGLTNFMQDETVMPALEAMIPQFQADIVLFGQLKRWGHWHVAAKDFISVGPALDNNRLSWGLMEINDKKIAFKVIEIEQ